MIGVVIPTLNEAENLPVLLDCLSAVAEVGQIIIADGGSSDSTCNIALERGARVLRCTQSRGSQMREAARYVQEDIVWFVHADTTCDTAAGQAIESVMSPPDVVGGACWKVFQQAPWYMRGARIRCALRFYLFHRFLGDQAIFVKRQVLETIGGFPDVPLMEEYELLRKLKGKGRLVLAPTVVRTSARRFMEKGVLRTYGKMGWITLLYLMGKNPEQLRLRYER